MPDNDQDLLHEIWVWEADEFLKVNEALKSSVNADVIALSMFIKSGTQSARQIKLLGIMGRAYIKVGKNRKKYIIFKGNAKLRPDLRGTRYLMENPKVSMFVVGKKAIIEDAAKSTKIAIIAFVAIDIIQELREDQFSLASLGVRILSDALQAVAAAAAGAAVGVFLTAVGAPTVVAFAVVVLAGFAVGMLLTHMDHKYQLTEMARARMMAYERQAKTRFSAAVAAEKAQISAAVRRTRDELEEAIAYYVVNRTWRTLNEFLRRGMSYNIALAR